MRPHPPSHPIIKCSKPLAANASAAPLDVIKMKSALGALGHYEAPKWGVSQFPDVALFDAIKRFQKSQGLKADGAIKPDGETEAALSQAMTPRRAQTALQTTAQALQSLGRGGDELLAHITKEEAALLHNVTDGATINPQTGLLEFWFGYSGDDDTKSYQDSVSQAANDTSLDDDSFWDGYEAATSAYDKANSDGKPGSKGGDVSTFGDHDIGSKGGRDNGGGVNGQSANGNASGALTATKEKETKAKAESAQRSQRANPQAQDISFTSGFFDSAPAPDPDLNPDDEDEDAPEVAATVDPKASKGDKPAPTPKADDGGQNKNEFSFFGNLAEDVRSILNGTAQGPHSQYDKHNADAMEKKTGREAKHFLPGGQYGPGGGSYSPSELHNAGLGYQGGASGLTTSKTEQNAQQEYRQRMADIAKARRRTRLADVRKKELERISAAQTITPQKDIRQKVLDYRTQASVPFQRQDGLLGRTPEQKAADVGEHGLTKNDNPSGYNPDETIEDVEKQFQDQLGINPDGSQIDQNQTQVSHLGQQQDTHVRDWIRGRAANAAKDIAKRHDITLTEAAAKDPKVQETLTLVDTLRSQNRIQKEMTMGAVADLSRKYSEFGIGRGMFATLATAAADREKVPAQMTDEELDKAYQRNLTTIQSLDLFGELTGFVSDLTGIKTQADYIVDSKEWFEKANKNIRKEIVYRSGR